MEGFVRSSHPDETVRDAAPTSCENIDVRREFVKEGEREFYDWDKTISAISICPADGEACAIEIENGKDIANSFTTGTSVGVEAGGPIAKEITGTISASASFEWTDTVTVRSGTKNGFSIPPGKEGRVVFNPRIKEVYGTLLTYNSCSSEPISRTAASGGSPVKLSGQDNMADGKFAPVYWNPDEDEKCHWGCSNPMGS